MAHKKFTSIFIFISSRSSSVKSGLSKIFIQAVFARFSVPIKILQKYFLSFRHGLIKLPSMDLERKLSSSSSAICLSSDMSTFANQLAKRHSSLKNHEKGKSWILPNFPTAWTRVWQCSWNHIQSWIVKKTDCISVNSYFHRH